MTSRRPRSIAPITATLALVVLGGCPPAEPTPMAEGIYGRLGEIRPNATPEQHDTFERGKAVATRRFTPAEGLGPLVNVSFCGACHEKPDFGGSGGHYRDFYLTATELADGGVLTGEHGGVVTAYGLGGAKTRPDLQEGVNIIAHRNPIPFFGVGLIAELPESSILANADPDDSDGDGISGRPNYDRGFVGRFGRKAQTVSIEGFIRGPLNNHLGITSDPLSEEDKARLPVPSDSGSATRSAGFRQAAAPDEPLVDDDDAPDPELSSADLFDLVSWAMLLAAPEPAELTESGELGKTAFAEVGCDGCHVPTLEGPRGLLPLYSDLLLHDMGPELADGIVQGVAEGNEYRTPPLWGIAAVGPYLHDGRADTLRDAIVAHGGEGEGSRDAFLALDDARQAALITFLEALGGLDQRSEGLVPPGSPIPAAGEPGAPFGLAGADDEALWLAGRALFDRDTPLAAGLGPLFNGDSCRACHFDPVIGGAGPLGVNVMRHGTRDGDTFVAPAYGTILAKLSVPGLPRREADVGHNVFEPRQTPTTLGLGLIDGISEDTILGLADPDDLDGDGIRGIVAMTGDGRVGRFGWKASVPSVAEFARDALSNEVGLTVPEVPGHTFGFLSDDDAIADPEINLESLEALVFYLEHLDAPAPVAEVAGGLELFAEVGCDVCHVPELPGAEGPVALFSDLLLHDVAADGYFGVADGIATPRLFRTAPLWGISSTAPYMHDGAAATIEAAIAAHDGEAATSRDAFDALPAADRQLLLDFLGGL
ncbi:MAG: hypothetical protein H6711_27570 [Myxococcales bacterium]|nr:hypothetical protein [Myxococcales bacterium]